MLINIYKSHVAYTFEDNETMFPLGIRVLSKMALKEVMESNTVIYNGHTRLLYSLGGASPLQEIISNLSESEIISIMKQFLNVVCALIENDFVDKAAMDVNFARLFYNTKERLLRCVVLPINTSYELYDGLTWEEKYRNSLALFAQYIFANDPEKYNEFFYTIMNPELSVIDLANILLSYDFGIKEVAATTDNGSMHSRDNKNNRIMILEHSGELGNLLFRIHQDEYILGKSQNQANGVINNTNSVSRKHCIIRKTPDGFTVEDLGSANGTRINGYGLTAGQQYLLNQGDVLQLSDIAFNVHME